MPIDKTRNAVAFSGGQVTISIFPEPRPMMETITTMKKTYLDSEGQVTFEPTGTRARRQLRNEAGQLLYTDAEGDTVNRYSRDGLTMNAPKEETYEEPVTETVPVFEADGVTQKLDYASINARISVIDSKARPYPESLTFTEERLSDDQKNRLIALWSEVLGEQATAEGLYPTPAAAREAGAITEG